MDDPLRRTELKERLKLTAGVLTHETGQPDAASRGAAFLNRQDERPLAVDYLTQEVAEKADKVDGRFLTQVLARLVDEVRVMLIRGNTRELALCLTKIQEAEHWAIESGRRTNSHVVIDRRIFKLDHGEEAQ